MIVFYSGTGNSRRAADVLARALQEDTRDAFHFIRDGIAPEFVSTTPWVFVSPTYAWQLPHIFRDFLLSGHFEGSRDAYFVMTCGSEVGNAAAHIRALCKEKGFTFRGLFPVIMPENYIAMFNAPQPDAAAPIIEKADRELLRAAGYIASREDFPDVKTSVLDHFTSGPVNKAFYRLFVKAGPFTVSDSCIGCGKCEKACVMGNIALKNGKPSWGSGCTHCMACICGCPVSAIEYGSKSRGKPRYQCPPYQKTE